MLTQKALPVRGFFVELSTQFTYNLLYWYKSTNSDTVFVLFCTNTASAWGLELGTQFTYNMLGTTVQILTHKAQPVRLHVGTQFT